MRDVAGTESAKLAETAKQTTSATTSATQSAGSVVGAGAGTGETVAALRVRARELGITGYSRLTKAELLTRIRAK